MPTPNSIFVDKLARLVGTAGCPLVLDVRPDDAFHDDPRLILGSIRRSVPNIAHCFADLVGRSAVVVCRHGRDLSHGAAAYLRQAGVAAEAFDGGLDAREAAGLPLVPEAKLPPPDAHGRTVWATRAGRRVDLIACSWLIRRFVDPDAVFLFVSPPEVNPMAERFAGRLRHRRSRHLLEPPRRSLRLRRHGREVYGSLWLGAATASPRAASRAPSRDTEAREGRHRQCGGARAAGCTGGARLVPRAGVTLNRIGSCSPTRPERHRHGSALRAHSIARTLPDERAAGSLQNHDDRLSLRRRRGRSCPRPL